MSGLTNKLRSFDRRLVLGVLFMCGSGVLFPIMNGVAKSLGGNYNSMQVSWARAFGHVMFMLIAFLPRYGLPMLRTKRPGVQVIRSALLFFSNLCFFFAITFIPIADAASISMTSPLIVALLAWPMLGERTTKLRLALLAVGFIGVLIVIRPGSDVFHPASLLVLVNSTCYGTYQILTRRISGVDSPETSAIYSSCVGAFLMLLVMPFVWKTPANLVHLGMFCSMGVLGAMGHYCVARSLQNAPANLVTPFQYFQLFGSVAVGYFAFGDLPDAMTWLGAAIIITVGLAMGWSQTRRTPA
jgi:drug/metabolite transporter (DMT)-like permease